MWQRFIALTAAPCVSKRGAMRSASITSGDAKMKGRVGPNQLLVGRFGRRKVRIMALRETSFGETTYLNEAGGELGVLGFAVDHAAVSVLPSTAVHRQQTF